jgi:hypothetical protein
MAAESFEVLKTNFFRAGAATAGSRGGAFVKMVFRTRTCSVQPERALILNCFRQTGGTRKTFY